MQPFKKTRGNKLNPEVEQIGLVAGVYKRAEHITLNDEIQKD
jgi:hypothetical protein